MELDFTYIPLRSDQSKETDNAIDLSSGHTLLGDIDVMVTFTIAGLNVEAGDRMHVVGEINGLHRTGTILRHVGGHNGDAGTRNFNAFRIFANNASLDGFRVLVQRFY